MRTYPNAAEMHRPSCRLKVFSREELPTATANDTDEAACKAFKLAREHRRPVMIYENGELVGAMHPA
jgi:hypothetical protein